MFYVQKTKWVHQTGGFVRAGLWTKLCFFLLFIWPDIPAACSTAPPCANQGVPSGCACISIIYTSDEHGWMEPGPSHGGAAGMKGLWNRILRTQKNTLILSGGDNWTGPAVSTWSRGESMVHVMNAMGYQASAIGNHEFDFNTDVLMSNLAKAEFPYLSANIVNASDGARPAFAQPYTVMSVGGVQVGIIGLTTPAAAYTTYPLYVRHYRFLPCDSVLFNIAPEVRSAGADVVIALGHVPSGEWRALMPAAGELGIAVCLSGHSHQEIIEKHGGVLIVEPGANMACFSRVDMVVDTLHDRIISADAEIIPNTGGRPDSVVAAVVNEWKSRMDKNLSRIIGYTGAVIPRDSDAMGNMVTDSWLAACPGAHVSMTNSGGIRQHIPEGTITMETIWGVLPFDNRIVQVDLNGSQLAETSVGLLHGGMTTRGGFRLADGTAVHPDSQYQVLITDYLYYHIHYPFKTYDPEPELTDIHYRTPVIDWIESLHTTHENPLNDYLDPHPR